MDLNACYAIGGKSYQKHEAQITVNALDYATMYLWPETKFRHWKKLCDSIEEFLKS